MDTIGRVSTDARAQLEQALARHASAPPIEIALELCALADESGLLALGELVADRDHPRQPRAIALLAIAIVLARDPKRALPDGALDALEDPDLVDAALAGGLAAALTGVLLAAPNDATMRATRTWLGRRMVASGERGPHIVELLLAAGDRKRACELAAEQLGIQLEHAGEALWVELNWLARRTDDEALVADILGQLATDKLAELARALTRVPAADARAIARLRAAVGWLLDERAR
jgi:hypothetical protein